ncbi:MAG: hypothetical protein RQ750_11210 [Roseovarius sp.]|nr:hypothetical protein [Roseovarius sp.]
MMNAIKDRMLSRRAFFTVTAAAGATIALGPLTAPAGLRGSS